MSHTPTTSVVICTYTDKRWDWLGQAVASVRGQDVAPGEIILVSDHNDELFARMQSDLEGVRVVANTEAQGLSGARNSGIAAAGGSVVAFLDDDAIAAPGWLSTLVAAFDDPAVLAAGGRIEPMWPGERPRWWPPEFDWVIGCSYVGLPERRAPVRNLIGCNMAFRRSVFDEIGTFACGIGRVGATPLGCEETELCIRVRQRWPDAEILYEPAALVHHRVEPARTTWRYFRRRCAAEGRSKALVSLSVGSASALSSERAHVRHALVPAVGRAVTKSVRERDLDELRRAGSTAGGLVAAGVGFALAHGWRR